MKQNNISLNKKGVLIISLVFIFIVCFAGINFIVTKNNTNNSKYELASSNNNIISEEETNLIKDNQITNNVEYTEAENVDLENNDTQTIKNTLPTENNKVKGVSTRYKKINKSLTNVKNVKNGKNSNAELENNAIKVDTDIKVKTNNKDANTNIYNKNETNITINVKRGINKNIKSDSNEESNINNDTDVENEIDTNGSINTNTDINTKKDIDTNTDTDTNINIDSNKDIETKKFIWPCPDYTRISNYFGHRSKAETNGIGSTNHKGIDMAAPYASNILAARSGKVILASYKGGYGNCVMIDHGDGIVTLYGNASSICCSVGQNVKSGDVIAKVGSTGNSTGNHLHFSVLVNGKYVDPALYMEIK